MAAALAEVARATVRQWASMAPPWCRSSCVVTWLGLGVGLGIGLGLGLGLELGLGLDLGLRLLLELW